MIIVSAKEFIDLSAHQRDTSSLFKERSGVLLGEITLVIHSVFLA